MEDAGDFGFEGFETLVEVDCPGAVIYACHGVGDLVYVLVEA